MPDEPVATQEPVVPATSKPTKTESDLVQRTKELEARFELERKQREEFQQTQLLQIQEKLAREQIERARAQARVQFPDADQELLSEYPSKDPDEILVYASKLHEKAQFRFMGLDGVPRPPTNASDAAL